MIASTQDLMVHSIEDFERLPEDGFFEVVDGRAILLPANDFPHQEITLNLAVLFRGQLGAVGFGHVAPAVNVFIPRPADALSDVQNRVPDLVVSKQRPSKRFDPGEPPELVIEILSTRRGNVERTEKMDDYALAGIGEYWIVNPFDRVVEVYWLESGDYVLQRRQPDEPLHPRAFPGVRIEPSRIWAE